MDKVVADMEQGTNIKFKLLPQLEVDLQQPVLAQNPALVPPKPMDKTNESVKNQNRKGKKKSEENSNHKKAGVKYHLRSKPPAPIPEEEDKAGENADDGKTADLTLANFAGTALTGRVGVMLGRELEPPAGGACQSPLASGNLGSMRAKDVAELEAQQNGSVSPPSSTSTMSANFLAARLDEVAESVSKVAECTGASTAAQFGTKLYNNVDIDKILSNAASDMNITKHVHVEIFEQDPGFAPVGLTRGRKFAFATSQASNQVYVFDEKFSLAGVLKCYGSKLFSSPHNVHFIPGIQESDDYIVVLDDTGFHFFRENGTYVKTAFKGTGNKFRGLTSFFWPNPRERRRTIVSLDISSPAGTFLVLFDADKDESLSGRIFLEPTRGKSDSATKCRFVAIRESSVFVTAMSSNEVIKVDLIKKASSLFPLYAESNKMCNTTFAGEKLVPDRRPMSIKSPTGIALDHKARIYIACPEENVVQVFSNEGRKSHELGSEGKLVNPIGLCIDQGYLYVANRAKITKYNVDV